MQARQRMGGVTFPPDALRVVFEAFDAAWSEVASDVTGDPAAVETALSSLATIVLSLAAASRLDRDDLKAAAVEAFKLKYRIV
jgi:hypothetical protein